MTSLTNVKFLYLLLSVVLVSACEIAIELDDPYPGNRLVINGLIHPDSMVRVQISQSRSVLDKDITDYYYCGTDSCGPKEPYYKPVHGAAVRLYEDDILVATLTEDSADSYRSNYYPKADREYRLEVEKKGFPAARATTIIPKINAEILDLTFELTDKYSYDGGSSYTYELLASIEFRDAVGKDYYEIQKAQESFSLENEYRYIDDSLVATIEVKGPFVFYYGYTSQLESKDLLFLPYEFSNFPVNRVFQDELFENKTKVISFKEVFSGSGLSRIKEAAGIEIIPNMHVQLRNVSYDYYSYFYSLALQVRSEENPFSEPVQLYSNVENGYGIFAGYNAQVKKFPIPWLDW